MVSFVHSKLLVDMRMMLLLSTWIVPIMNWADRKDMLKLSEEVLRLKHGPGLKVVWHSAVPRFPILAPPVAWSNGASRNDVIARLLNPGRQPCQVVQTTAVTGVLSVSSVRTMTI